MESNLRVIRHQSRRMAGRDPLETHRVATPLELLFDLTFATCFSLAASQFADAMAAGRYAPAFLGFAFASFAICWAWINFSWFSSAYDTDDWIFRVVTMVQMVGVLVLAIGLPRMFASIERHQHLDNSIMVLGYVIMRVALVFQWLRAARQDPVRRRECLTYAASISIAQVGWVVQIAAPMKPGAAVILGVFLALVEMMSPLLAERWVGGTPWHAHHIAERYGLFALIAFGESVVGTAAALSAGVYRNGWTLDAVLIGFAGTGLTFAMWWMYYLVPFGEILQRYRNRAAVWGYAQILVITSIVATGAGLRVAAYFIEGKVHITVVGTVLTVAAPVVSFLGLFYALSFYLIRKFRKFDALLFVASNGVAVLAVIAATAGVPMATCLVILVLAPTVPVVAYEVLGYRHLGAFAESAGML